MSGPAPAQVQPRLIATDLDGTLLRSDGSLGPRTRRMLAAAVATGVPVVLATARPLRWLDRSTTWRAYASYAVFSNGALVYDVAAREVVGRSVLTPGALADLCRRILSAVPAARFAVEVEDGRRMWHEPEYPLRSDLGDPAAAPAPLAELIGHSAVKLLVKAPGAEPARFVEGVVRSVRGIAEVSISATPADLVELGPPGVTKATGLAAVADRLGVAAAGAVAFGDMPNDLPMLRWAGRAVAVANAHPEVVAVAHEVTASNDEEGVAAWLAAAWGPQVPVPRLPTAPDASPRVPDPSGS